MIAPIQRKQIMSAIISSVDLKSYVGTVAEVVGLISDAHNLLMEARSKCKDLGIDEYEFNLALSNKQYETFAMVGKQNWLPNAKKGIDAQAWDQLFSRSGLRSFMDREAREVWDKQIYAHNTPEFTSDNVRETFRDLYKDRERLWRRGLVNVFRSLSRRYVANNVWSIGKKLIVHCVFDRPPFSSLSHTAFDSLDDLLRVFCLMDGKPEPDHRNNLYHLARKQLAAGSNKVQSPYLDVILYRVARTAHVSITRLDLQDRVNKVLAEEFANALPHDKAT